MKQTYPPLALLSGEKFPQNYLNNIKQYLAHAQKDTAFTQDEFVRYVMSNRFILEWDEPWQKDLSMYCRQNTRAIQLIAGTDKFDPATEWRDILAMPLMLEDWARNKQVYKPDPDFAAALLRTKGLELTENIIKRLPCDSFYIDLSECNFDPAVGAFIFTREIDPAEKDISVSVCLLTKEMVTFSFYLEFRFKNEKSVKLDNNEITEADYVTWNMPLKGMPNARFKDPAVTRKEVSVLALQLMCYLSIEKPQVTASPLTAKTYRPPAASSAVKNKWSEVEIHDVGITYGTAFRKTIREQQARTAQQETQGGGEHSHRKSPVPHFRCAHWHTYRVGKGRQETRVNWIEPTFIAGSQAQNITIHTVTDELTKQKDN